MSSTQPTRVVAWYGGLRDPHLERLFLRTTQEARYRTISFVSVLTGTAYGVTAFTIMARPEIASSWLDPIVFARLIAWALGLLAAFTTLRRMPETVVQIAVLVYFFSLGISECIEVQFAPQRSLSELPILSVIILIFYIFNPLYLYSSLSAGLASSIAYVTVILLNPAIGRPQVIEVAVVLGLINGLGAFFQFEMLQRRRNEFVVLEQEKTLNRQLKQEIERRKALEDQLRTMAETDPLTSIFNRRYFTGSAEREVKRSLRYGEELSLMILDLDHFKQVNDRFGHSRGDDVLQAVVSVIEEGLREVDVFARLGGEEFGILLPNTDLEAAHTAAERIRQAIENYEQPLPAGFRRVTVSIGVAQLRESDGGLDELYKRTDDALYSAKQHGRNRTAVASA